MEKNMHYMQVVSLKVDAAYAEYGAISLQPVSRKRVVVVLVIVILVIVVVIMVIVLVHREIRNLPVFATIVRKWDIVKKDCFKKKKDEASGETAAMAASCNGNEAAEMMCLGFEIFDSEKTYEEVPSMEECPNLVGCCMF
jgi:predicted membrane protein